MADNESQQAGGASKSIDRRPDFSGEVHQYLTQRLIDGSPYGEQICARSWEEAERIAGMSGTKLLGALGESRCAQCGSVIIAAPAGEEHVPATQVLGPDEWPDDINA